MPKLNASRARGSNHSVNSLPAPQTTCSSAHGSVGSWAESFETLLQDRVAVTYFTEFLKKEFSAENVYFWQACERFQQIPASDTQQLAQEARRIYDEFLSSHSVSPVNIDRQAWIGEEMLANPSPDMFRLQQLQVRQSPPPPPPPPHPPPAPARVPGLPQLLCQPGPGLPLLGQHGRQPLDGGESSPRRPRAATGPADGGSPVPQGHRKSLGGSEAEAKPTKYCCVYLPDGTASLAAVRPGLSIRDMLAGICEKRGFSLPDIKVYLVGNEQKALVLDQECCVLADQEVKLENRISFDLEISSLSKTIRITAKSTKRIREALQPVLGKYGVNVELVLLRRQGESAALDLEKLVSTVAAQKLVLETPAGNVWGQPCPLPSHVTPPSCASPLSPSCSRGACPAFPPGLVELLNRAQSCRANDQRGLLSKEDLVLPDFLQLPGQDGSACGGSNQPSAPHPGSEGNNHPGPAAEPAPAQPAVKQEPR
uniref:Regulator of G-protein signaling 14 n=1 Tax=Anser cygnoides TaxID=8845 RepID=A0A8B9EPB5_ANSCY